MANHHGGLIDPSKFPARAADLDVARIEQSATDLGRVGRAIEDGTVQVDASWSRLTGCYSAPEQEQVYRLMVPAVASAGSVRSALVRASGHLDTYASTLAALKPRLAAFEKRAAAFRAKVADGVWVDASSAKDASFGDHLAWAFDWVPGVDERRVKVPWYEDEHTVAKNGDLLDEYAGLLAEISSAASGCATAVNALVSGVRPEAVQPIPAAAFTAADGDPMPWGTPGVEDRNCRESVGHGGHEFGKSLVQGVGSLILGYNPENGEFWNGSTYAQTWGGAVDLVASLVLLSNPLYARDAAAASFTASAGGTLDRDAAFKADRFDTAASAVGSLIGYDPAAEDGWHEWREDGWATGTEAVLNVGSFFIPGAGEAGGALKGASVAVKVTRFTEAAADFAVQGSSWVVRGGVRVVTGLRDALLHVHLDDLASTVRAGEVVDAGTLGTRLNPTALVHALDDAPPAPGRSTAHDLSGNTDHLREGPGDGGRGSAEGRDRPSNTPTSPHPDSAGDAPAASDAASRDQAGGEGGGGGMGGGGESGGGGDGGLTGPVPPTTGRAAFEGAERWSDALERELADRGMSRGEFDNLVSKDITTYSSDTVKLLIDVRDAMPRVAPTDIMQKVLPPDIVKNSLAHLQGAFNSVSDPQMLRAIAAKSTSYVANRVDGFVLRAVDALGVDSNQLFHRLGLAYDGQRWTAPGETFDGNLVAVRYRLDQVFDGAGERLGVPRVPRSPLDTMNEAMHLPSTDGHSSSLLEQIRSIPDGEQRAKEWQAFADTRGVQASESMARALLPPNGPAHSYDPFRGNGFSGTGHGSFPEYDYGFEYGRGVPIFGAMPEGAEMWVLKPDGTEAVVARFDGVEWELP